MPGALQGNPKWLTLNIIETKNFTNKGVGYASRTPLLAIASKQFCAIGNTQAACTFS